MSYLNSFLRYVFWVILELNLDHWISLHSWIDIVMMSTVNIEVNQMDQIEPFNLFE